jgi:F-type H+-transporting ATPase subunit epsilon
VPTRAELVTPERVLFEGEADFVVMRTEGGEIMFLPHHADFVGAVDICVVRVALATESGGASAGGHGDAAGAVNEVRAAVHGGFVHVADNRVTVLASVAELADEIDVDRARRALEEAEAAVAGGDEGPAPGVAPVQAPAKAGGAGAGGVEHGEEEQAGGGIEESPTMLALLHPEAAEVRLRRAQARLEAAGVLDSTGSTAAAH